MADLSTLDSAVPASTDAVADGDDTIRATREAVKTSFGGTDSGTGAQLSEHYLLGFHKFPMGATATRPTAGNAGRVFIDTDYYRVERDTGSEWAMLNASQVYQETGSLVTNITTSWKTLVTKAINVPKGGRVVAYGMALLIPTSTVTISMKLVLDSTTMQPAIGVGAAAVGAAESIATSGGTIHLLGHNAPASAGSYTITLQAKLESPYTAYGTGGLIILVV